ncbi:endonuclease domain-containing protein [Stappia sp. ES.058]|uniref:endonuclease domain-containing protein n=1 Tax=Stappia sp. ES.058 TaxID=1881061 RepID=UPI00087AB82F|nr:DUF559 domain-containing protein [Stappia sp. ES.058]SDU16946.1 Very-short-patch-repair endonuclease [Stappia sp. ES.058]
MPHHDVSKSLRGNAKSLRRTMTPAEKKLWNILRAHRLDGIAFRRQLPIAGYIVDFAAPAHKLIVELDGSQHGEAHHFEADRARDAHLAASGWTVLRFRNPDVLNELDGVCSKILEARQRGGNE